MIAPDPPAPRRGREGGRWLNERPTSEEFADWFTASMRIDPALDIENYIGGVVLIPGVDTKSRFLTGFTDEGKPILDTREELSYVPYAKVETRVAYWWDLLEAHPEWVGVVEHIATPRMPIDLVTEEEVRDGEQRTVVKRRQPGALAILTHQLPTGFSIMSVPVSDGYSHFLCATVRVSIHRRGEDGEPQGRALRTGRGTKQVPLVGGYANNPSADASALMKAETGAMGRALGFAGIFVIPGSGVATAEDMLEAIAQGSTPISTPANAGPAAPDAPPVRSGAEQATLDEDELRRHAGQLYQALSAQQPAKAEEFGAWCRQRRIASLSDVHGAMLRGVIKKLERLSDGGVSDVSAQTPAGVDPERSDGEPSRPPA